MIPFMNLSDCHNMIMDEVTGKIISMIKNSDFIGGEEVALFEKEFADYSKTKYAVGCANGTDALILALIALGVGVGDAVITAPNTFIATTEAISAVGAKILFVDVDEFYTMDCAELEKCIKENDNVKAIIPVHLFGQMAAMDDIKKIADRYELKIVEDAAQAHGAELKGNRAGFYGDAATFSFYPGKNLGAFGDAGAVVTNSEELYIKMKMLSNHGRLKKKYEHEIEGFNKRIDSIQAAILRIKLRYIENWTEMKIANAEFYKKRLSDSEIELPKKRLSSRHVYHLFVIKSSNRDSLINTLKENSVSSGIHYPIPLHLQPAYKNLGYIEGNFPVSEQASKRIVSLPIWPEMKKEMISTVCDIIKNHRKVY